jgi:valyl-tRNA synthetase
MQLLQDIIVSVRNIRGELNIKPSLPLTLLVRTKDEDTREFLDAHQDLIASLARLGEMHFGADVTAPKASATNVVAGHEVFVPLSGAVDFDDELARLEKEIAKAEKTLSIVEKKLSNAGFVNNAPQDVVDGERAKAAELTEKKDKLVSLQQRLREAIA